MCYEHLMFFTIFPADPRCSQQRSWIRWLWNTRGTYRGDSLAHWWMVLRGFDSHRFVSTTSEQPIQCLRSIDFKSADPNQLWLKLEFWWGFYEYDNLKVPHLHLLGLAVRKRFLPLQERWWHQIDRPQSAGGFCFFQWYSPSEMIWLRLWWQFFSHTG